MLLPLEQPAMAIAMAANIARLRIRLITQQIATQTRPMLHSKGKEALKRIVMFRNVFVRSQNPHHPHHRYSRATFERRTSAKIRSNVGPAAGRGCGKVGRQNQVIVEGVARYRDLSSRSPSHKHCRGRFRYTAAGRVADPGPLFQRPATSRTATAA